MLDMVSTQSTLYKKATNAGYLKLIPYHLIEILPNGFYAYQSYSMSNFRKVNENQSVSYN
jgi:hypothetical protein